jgi:hypothetical protein
MGVFGGHLGLGNQRDSRLGEFIGRDHAPDLQGSCGAVSRGFEIERSSDVMDASQEPAVGCGDG